jgi:hypothetical protein
MLYFVVDLDDPKLEEYRQQLLRWHANVDLLVGPPESTMVKALNYGAKTLLELDQQPAIAIGFMGDDHRPRSVAWDNFYVRAIMEGNSFVYGNDGFQGENLPTQVAMNWRIPKVLGWMAPPCLNHMYVDNAWLYLGSKLGTIRYLPDVLVEHMHPATGKLPCSLGHVRVNSSHMYQQDQMAYEHWVHNHSSSAVAELKMAGL